jgi:hypothetical protein
VEREEWDRESTRRERDGSKRALGEREREREGVKRDGWRGVRETSCFVLTLP